MADLLTIATSSKSNSGTCKTPLCLDAGRRDLDCSPVSHERTGLETHGPRAIALIDSRLPFQEELLRSIDPDVCCFALTSESTFRTITEILGQFRNLEALHLVAHGAPGQLYLGGTWVTTQTLLNHGAQIAQSQMRCGWPQSGPSTRNVAHKHQPNHEAYS